MADKKKVLIVDDDHVVRAVIGKVSEKHGAIVCMAGDGKTAQEAVERMEDFDVVFLDLMMPHISGWDVLDSIKNNAKTKNIPVVIISGASVSDKEKEKLSQKVTAFVDKETFSLAEFERIVADLLNQ